MDPRDHTSSLKFLLHLGTLDPDLGIDSPQKSGFCVLQEEGLGGRVLHRELSPRTRLVSLF